MTTLLMLPPQTPITREWAKRLAAAQPDVSVIVAENESEAAAVIAQADAAFGTVSPALLRAASKLALDSGAAGSAACRLVLP